MEKLETVLSELVKKAIDVAEKTGEFAMEQAPLLLQEFYKWHIAKSIVFILIASTIFIFSKYISNLFGEKEPFKWIRNAGYSFSSEEESVLIRGRYYKKNSDSYIGAIVFRYLGIIIFLIIFFTQLYKIIFITIAPKLYLIEYFIK